MNDLRFALWLICVLIYKRFMYESRKATYDIGTKILFSFDESLLDAESSLEDVLDTNITSFLRRFWIRYQNGITSDLQKVTFLILQVVFFQKFPPGGLAKPWNLCSKTHQMSYITLPYDISISHHHMISPYDIYVSQKNNIWHWDQHFFWSFGEP